MITKINIPTVSIGRITPEVIAKTDLMLKLLAVTSGIGKAEEEIAAAMNSSLTTIRGYKTSLRKMFNLADGCSMAPLAEHPQIRQAIEGLLVRKVRTDRLQLRSAKRLDIRMHSGELVSVQEFVRALYLNENATASSCYRSILARCKSGLVYKEDGTLATVEDLPVERSVVRFLRQCNKEFLAIQRARARENDWQKKMQPYVTRDVTQYAPGELWIGDHTELDFMVLNEKGTPDRRWITTFIDIRTGLLVGYHLSWQPNSTTIALAFRAAVLGSQLKAYTSENKYVPVTNAASVPDEVMIDNGKDYRSKYTQRLLGRIDFDDKARLAIQRLTKLHYTMPYHGQSKAQMERWFGSFQTMLKNLPGYKGNVYGRKPDTLKDDLKQGHILTVDVFDEMIALGVNVINNRVRRSLKGETPIQHYLTHQRVNRGIDVRVLDFLMMKSEQKVVQRCQVRLKNAEYYSDALMAFNGRRADVYYDPSDLGFVSVYVDGEFAAVACNKELIGQDERGYQRILADRARLEKDHQQQINSLRRGISKTDARIMLLHGELSNTAPVDSALLAKDVPGMIIRTGLEEQAKEVQQHIDQEMVKVDVEERARRKKKAAPLTMEMVSRIR